MNTFLTQFLRGKTQHREQTAPNIASLDTLDESQLPILDSNGLITLLGLEESIRSIRKLAGISDKHFALLYQPAINNVLEAAQLAPGSASHHHSGKGGFIAHTLDVVQFALRHRRANTLPVLADPEQIADEEHQWTYAVFCAALLHDVGKLIYLSNLNLDTGEIWTPHARELSTLNAKSYSVLLLKANYVMQKKASLSLFHLIPSIGRHWLCKNKPAFQLLNAYLYASPDSGIIGEIVGKADMESTARNVGNAQSRFRNIPSPPLIERLMLALRHCLDSELIGINRNGGGAWVAADYTYLVCGTAVSAVVAHLEFEGANDIPPSNTRLFSEFQEHGYALPTPEKKAVWFMRITHTSQDPLDNYSHEFSMLKFRTNTLFPHERLPVLFEGDISICEERKAKGKIAETDQAAQGTLATLTLTDSTDVEENSQSPATGLETNATSITPQLSAQEPSTAISIFQDEIVDHFIQWLRYSIETKGVQVNNAKAVIHIVKEGVLLVSPRVFQKYVSYYDFHQQLDPSADDSSTQTRAFKMIQKRLQKTGLNIKANNGANVHIYEIVGPRKTSNIIGYLLPTEILFEKSPPPVNALLKKFSPSTDTTAPDVSRSAEAKKQRNPQAPFDRNHPRRK